MFSCEEIDALKKSPPQTPGDKTIWSNQASPENSWMKSCSVVDRSTTCQPIGIESHLVPIPSITPGLDLTPCLLRFSLSFQFTHHRSHFFLSTKHTSLYRFFFFKFLPFAILVLRFLREECNKLQNFISMLNTRRWRDDISLKFAWSISIYKKFFLLSLCVIFLYWIQQDILHWLFIMDNYQVCTWRGDSV